MTLMSGRYAVGVAIFHQSQQWTAHDKMSFQDHGGSKCEEMQGIAEAVLLLFLIIRPRVTSCDIGVTKRLCL